MINLDDLEAEAAEVRRRYNNYQALRLQHRKRVMNLLDEDDNTEERKEMVRILMITGGGE